MTIIKVIDKKTMIKISVKKTLNSHKIGGGSVPEGNRFIKS